MPGPITTFVQLPDDAGNTGKRVRAQSRQVLGLPVYEHLVVSVRRAELLGIYRTIVAQQAVAAAAQDGIASGFLWAHVPIAITNKKVRVRKVAVSSQVSSAAVAATSARLRLARFSFTGTASGATVSVDKIDSAFPTPILDLRTAPTGLTIALVSGLGAAPLPAVLTAVGTAVPVENSPLDQFDEDEWEILAPGEGVVLYQDVAGVAADPRRFNATLVWDEVDVG